MLCDVFAQYIVASKRRFYKTTKRRVLRGCLCMAARVEDCQLFLAAAWKVVELYSMNHQNFDQIHYTESHERYQVVCQQGT